MAAGRVLFLDIDGVLLTPRSWLTPENDVARAMMRTDKSAGLRAVRVDRVAVALVNRLCRAGGAAIVILSGWRYAIGAIETRARLEAEGLDRGLFHPAFAAPCLSYRQSKTEDLGGWIHENGWPDRAVILDDEDPGDSGRRWLVQTNADAGLTLRAYRQALYVFGGHDAEAGLAPLDADVEARLLTAFGNDRHSLARWLYGQTPSPLAMLQVPDSIAALSLGKTPATLAEETRHRFWQRVEEETRRPEVDDDF